MDKHKVRMMKLAYTGSPTSEAVNKILAMLRRWGKECQESAERWQEKQARWRRRDRTTISGISFVSVLIGEVIVFNMYGFHSPEECETTGGGHVD
jgi:hypothetical protein